MDARLYDRLAATMSVVFLLVLGAGTYYLAAWANRDSSPAIQTKTNDPDVFLEGVSLTRTDQSGMPIFQMAARSMRHFPIDGSSEFVDPRLTSLDPSKPIITLRADQAIASAQGKETVLSGNVIMERQTAIDRPVLIVRTESLTLLSDNQVAQTDFPVEIQQGDAHLTATGMQFDNLTRDLKLTSQVQAIWPEAGKKPPGKVSLSR